MSQVEQPRKFALGCMSVIHNERDCATAEMKKVIQQTEWCENCAFTVIINYELKRKGER